jgi:hypothetical protein
MTFEHGAGFRICGAVVRRFVAPSGKVAFLTLGVPGPRGEVKHELRTFKEDLIVEVGSLGVGQIVQVTGSIDNERLTDKSRKEVTVDGRAAWVTKLTIKAIAVEGVSKASAPKQPERVPGADLDNDEELF